MREARKADESLIETAGTLVSDQDLEQTLRQLLELACSALPGGDEGGITLIEPEGPRTAIATSDIALSVDSMHYAAATSGPGLEAYRRQQVVRIDFTSGDDRWPEFTAAAAAHGLNSTLSVPLVVDGDGLGALNLYSRRRQGFTAADERLAVNLGGCASVALGNVRAHWRTARLADQLQQALSTRGVIDQATGILIAQHGWTAGHAFHLLTATAQRNRLSVTDVAADLVQRASAAEESGAAPGAATRDRSRS